MITNYVGNEPENPKCLLCKKAIEVNHTRFRDTITKEIVHDYCYRTETATHFAIRQREKYPVEPRGSVRFA